MWRLQCRRRQTGCPRGPGAGAGVEPRARRGLQSFRGEPGATLAKEVRPGTMGMGPLVLSPLPSPTKPSFPGPLPHREAFSFQSGCCR